SKNLSTISSSASSPKLPNPSLNNGSINAPVTPLLSSSTSRTLQMNTTVWEEQSARSGWS
ncbi:hypothetical protein RYX36_018646, partial [Vicia faba]